MADNSVPGRDEYFGRVRPGTEDLKASTLVGQFKDDVGQAVEAIVLRGYAGNTTYVLRALEFMRIAARNGQDPPPEEKQAVKDLRTLEEEKLARIYLTPRLDRYVDFHRSCILAWRYEAKSDRQDMVTVWLRRYDKKNVPITYLAVDEAVIGASPYTYLGGDLLDDFLDQTGSQAGAWGNQAGGNLGNKPWTRATGC